MTFGEKIKSLRKSKGMNQTQLANALGVSYGLSAAGKQKDVIPNSTSCIRN